MTDRIRFGDYVKIDAVNWSTLSSMRKSPLHYRHVLDHGRLATKEMLGGRATHSAVFEPDRFPIEYAVFDGPVRRGAAWQAFKAANPGRGILKIDEYERALAIRDAVRAHPEAMAYLAKGHAEQTLTWVDPITGLACKGRIDFVSDSKPAVLDLKTSREILLELFARTVLRLGYHTQSAFYADGWKVSHGEELPSVIIAVESAAPYDVGVFRLDEDTVALGQEEYAGLLAKVSAHRALKTWPGQYPLEMPLRLPPWAFGDDDVSELGLED